MRTLSVDDLKAIKQKAEHVLSIREQSNSQTSEESCGLEKGTEHLQVLCCGGTGCKASESALIAENLKASIKMHGIEDKVDVITTGCFGFCEKGPIVKVIPDNTFYTQVKPADAEEIVTEHLIAGRKVERLLYMDPETKKHISDSKHMNCQGRIPCPSRLPPQSHARAGDREDKGFRSSRTRRCRLPHRKEMGILPCLRS